MGKMGAPLNKGYIVRKLRERGLSRRRSVQLLNRILDELAAALARGEDVEFPFGSQKRVHHPHKKQQGCSWPGSRPFTNNPILWLLRSAPRA
jgi:hypothetical protein